MYLLSLCRELQNTEQPTWQRHPAPWLSTFHVWPSARNRRKHNPVGQDKKSSVPTRNELVTLLKTAKEPPEHRRIAAYYRQEAARLTQSAQEHSELAAIYQERHPFAAMESKHGDAFGQGASHCEK